MGLSIKREDTETLARRVAALTGESLTDAIHAALEERMKQLGHALPPADRRDADMQAWFAALDARPRTADVRGWRQIEEEDLYGPDGQPIA